MDDPVLLVGDIGGTNARFALASARDTGFSNGLTMQCRDYPNIEQALDEYLERVGAGRPDAICLAAAGPVNEGRVRLTNNDWSIDCRELAEAFGTARVRLINDFEAVACSLPLLAPHELTAVGSAMLKLSVGGSYKVAALGPGTGLGTAGLLSQDGHILHVVGEGGHMNFAAATDDQLLVFQVLVAGFQFGDAAAEVVEILVDPFQIFEPLIHEDFVFAYLRQDWRHDRLAPGTGSGVAFAE